MVETRVSPDFADQAVRLAGTKRALASAAMMDLRMQLAAQRDRRALDDFGTFALARPVRVAALLDNRPDPLVLAAVAGDRAMRNLAGLSGRGTEGEKLKFATTLEGLAAKTARDHLELCRTDPAAARRLEARWARQRQPYRSGFLGEALQAMEATYGTACTVAQDQSQGRRPLITPPPGWSSQTSPGRRRWRRSAGRRWLRRSSGRGRRPPDRRRPSPPQSPGTARCRPR